MERHPETVLVVDDDPEVADVHVRLLGGLGYAARPQSNPELVEASLVRDSRIDLVLLDQSMPEMTGMEAAAQIQRQDPEARVILSSGHLAVDDPQS